MRCLQVSSGTIVAVYRYLKLPLQDQRADVCHAPRPPVACVWVYAMYFVYGLIPCRLELQETCVSSVGDDGHDFGLSGALTTFWLKHAW